MKIICNRILHKIIQFFFQTRLSVHSCNCCTAALFRIETAHRIGASTCTSLPCSWTVPTSNLSSRAVPSKLKDLKVIKPNHSLKNGDYYIVDNTLKVYIYLQIINIKLHIDSSFMKILEIL